MPNIIVDYNDLGVVQTAFNNLADVDLTDAYKGVSKAQETIEKYGSGHDNIWSDVASSLQSEKRDLDEKINEVRDLSDKSGEVSETFTDDEHQIIENVDRIDSDLADYFGLDRDISKYTITPNTAADTSSTAQTIIKPDYNSPAKLSLDAPTGATTSTSPATTAVVSKMNNEANETNTETTQTIENKQETQQEKEEEKQEKDNSRDKKAQEEQDTSRDIKDSSTYKQAKENAEEVSQKTSTKNISTETSEVAGPTTTAIGSATEAASNIGKTTSTSTTTKKDDTIHTEEKEETPVNIEVKGTASGDIIDDDFVINDDLLETDSGTHHNSPIDVTLDKNTSADVIPGLAGVAAAGLTGIGTKVVLDKKENEDEEEETEEETFNGDYDIAGEEDNQLLDSSDDIGFNPETIIEEDDKIEQTRLEKDVYPQSVLQDIQSKEELM